VLAEWNVVNLDGCVADHSLARLVIRDIEQMSQRHFEGACDFSLVELELKPGLHECDHRRNPKTCQNQMRIEVANEANVLT
jgi:hypothetical protein